MLLECFFKVDGYLNIAVKVKPAASFYTEGGILSVILEKNAIIELSDFDQMKWKDVKSDLLLDAFLVNLNRSFSSADTPGINFVEESTFFGVELELDRKVSQKDINDLEINKMPGFRVIWSYDTQISETPFVDYKLKDEFIK